MDLEANVMRAEEDAHMADLPPYPGTPRWVKVSGIVVGVLVLLVVILLVAGGGPGRHGPGRHIPGNDTPPSSVTGDAPGDLAPPIENGVQ